MTGGVKPKILIVDDVEKDIERYLRIFLLLNTYDVEYASGVEEAIRKNTDSKPDLAIIDMMMPPGPLGCKVTRQGNDTGYALAAEFRKNNPSIKSIILTHYQADYNLDRLFKERLQIFDILDKTYTTPEGLVKIVDRIFSIQSLKPQVFIVHGHDRGAVADLQTFITTDFKWDTPVVLDEQASGGLTIIEKFEKFARNADIVFVLMTPDDVGASSASISATQFRARQNVFFELGYFFGRILRRSGRVFLFKKGDLEIPTDLAGIIYIDISGGLSSYKDRLRTELKMFV
jgi:CheY-like chemotaxis protein